MKYLSGYAAPRLTITRTTRKAIIDEVADKITLFETTTRIEITLPTIFKEIKTRFSRFVRSIFIPDLAHYCACA